MKTYEKILYFFVLPILAVLFYPPALLISGFGVILVAVAFFLGLGVFTMSGRVLALTFAIFLQGMNVIVRIMMFWSNSFSPEGVANIPFIVTSLAGMALSMWLVLRMDRQDIRVQMIR